MANIRVHHYNAFSSEPDKGNPAGVVFGGGQLTEAQMLEVAKNVGFNETAFVLKSNAADIRLRFFTPGQEMSLCGHATIASVFGLLSKGILHCECITVETKVGILPIKVIPAVNGPLMITMKQASPEFVPFQGSLDDLAASIGLSREEIDEQLPIVFGSTGTWTLLVPIKKLESFSRMTPCNEQFPAVLKQMPRTSVHPFCLNAYDSSSDMHARHFSSPFSGTVEDPVTGTASGVMGAYYKKYIRNDSLPVNLVIEQGHEIGRNGTVYVRVGSDGTYIEISGSAVYVREFDVEVV